MKSLLTGAGGFVGRGLLARFDGDAVPVAATVRKSCGLGVNEVVVGDIDANTDWHSALSGVEVVVHLAARVHVMREREKDPLAAFRRVNLDGTVNLAGQAAVAGARRFVYVSTVKVLGEESGDAPFTDASPCRPADPYSISKHEAEEALFEISRQTGLEVVVLRPPLVYGPGVGGNFLRLLRLAKIGAPLPFAKITNRRSMIFLENLVDALYLCATAKNISTGAYLVCDGVSLSIGDILRRLTRNMGKKSILLPVPPLLLRGAAVAFGLDREMSRLISSLEVDDSRFRRETGWHPVAGIEYGLRKTTAWFLKEYGR